MIRIVLQCPLCVLEISVTNARHPRKIFWIKSNSETAWRKQRRRKRSCWRIWKISLPPREARPVPIDWCKHSSKIYPPRKHRYSNVCWTKYASFTEDPIRKVIGRWRLNSYHDGFRVLSREPVSKKLWYYFVIRSIYTCMSLLFVSLSIHAPNYVRTSFYIWPCSMISSLQKY